MTATERMREEDGEVEQLRPSTIRFWRRAALASRVALACLAIVWIALGVMDVLSTVRAADWPSTTGTLEWVGHAAGGTIINVSRTMPTPRARSWIGTQELRYRYLVGGDTLFGWRVNVTQPKADGFRIRPRAWFDLGMAPPLDRGTVVTVHYDPTDARQSALSVRSSMATWFELAAGIAMLVALARPHRRDGEAPPL